MRKLVIVAFFACAVSAAFAQSPAQRVLILNGPAPVNTTPFDLDGTPQSAHSGAASTLALPAFSTTYGNDCVFVGIVTNGGPVTSITSSPSGLSFSSRKSQSNGGTTVAEFSATAASPLSAEVVTVNTTSSAFITIGVYAFSGCKTSAPFDSNGAIPNGITAGAATCTTSNANDILIGTAETVGVVNGGWTAAVPIGNELGTAYKIVAATQPGTAVGFSTFDAAGSICDANVKGP